MAKVLVSGGAGFIASNVVDKLVEKGYEVVIVDNLSSGYEKNLHKDAKFYKVDIREMDSLKEVFEKEKPDYVVHAAAQVQVVLSVEEPAMDAGINVIGSLNLLECCRLNPIKKFVYLCTGGALYGDPEYLPADEGHPIKPICPYGVSKHTAEIYLEMYHKTFGLDYVSLRFANVYGVRDDLKSKRVIPMFVDALLRGDKPKITGDGAQARDFINVKDVARAVVLAMETETEDRNFNIGSEELTTIKELFYKITKTLGMDIEPELIPSRAGEVQQIYLKAEKAENQLGWKCSIQLQDGLKEYIEWFKENNNTK